MRLEVRRSLRGTLSALVNLVLAWVTAVVVIGNQTVRAEPSVAWMILGALLFAWGGIIFSGLLRPVKLVADAEGLTILRLLGRHRFRWEDLAWANFELSEKLAVIAGRVGGRERFAAFSKAGVDAKALDEIQAVIRARRPGLPTARPAGITAEGDNRHEL